MLIHNLTFTVALPVDRGGERLSGRPDQLLPRRQVAPRVTAVLVLALSTCAILLAFATMARADPVLAAVGDIACTPGDTSHACQQSATANLAAGQAPAAVAVLGDNQYETGSLSEFNAPGAYNDTWGKPFNSIVHPVPGNHEYNQSGNTAAGYFSYFGAAALGPSGSQGPNGSYSYDLGSWHIIALNSDCPSTNACQDDIKGTTSSAQVSWLQSDLVAHPNQCTLAYWHHPLFSAGYVGNSPGVAPLWNALFAAHADVVLNGHDHMYERFAQQDSSQNSTSAGIREFVVGTGGESLFGVAPTPPPPKPELLDNTHFGVLFLTLHAASYDWKFVATDGTTVDSGSTACHAQPPPPLPPATTSTSASPPATTATSANPPAATSTSASSLPAAGPPPALQRLTFVVKSVGSGTFPSLRRHGLAVNVYCSRACDVLITVRVRRGRRLVAIARFRETESELPSPFTHLVLRGLWKSIRHLRVATLQLTFVAHDAAGHQVTIRRNSTQRR